MSPIQHAPVAVRAGLKEELDRMTEQEIIAPVTAPTPWVSSVVVVPKPNWKLRICLDPKELNKAIQREHYPLPTIEDVATRLHGAKIFTKLDVKNGFWHIGLDQESSYLTTFNTPFGKYGWKRMPFGLCSAPEVFQSRMHELIEGMPNVEMIADDFVVVGYGETQEEAIRNLVAFLKLCRSRRLKLNMEKIRLRQKGVSFIGHVATDKGLRVDPAKVKAIVEMPAPRDKTGVQRLLGLAQYLSKFLPYLSDLTKPLRELTQKEVEWCWGETQENAFRQLKEAVTRTPVLRYYNVKEPVTIQCDMSQRGLGAALLQNGQPVAYASRALSSAETRYTQIEKELLAIVLNCERFGLRLTSMVEMWSTWTVITSLWKQSCLSPSTRHHSACWGCRNIILSCVTRRAVTCSLLTPLVEPTCRRLTRQSSHRSWRALITSSCFPLVRPDGNR